MFYSFKPDLQVMARRSGLSAVTEHRHALEASVGGPDRQKLDRYYTSVRQLENQLDVEMTKPEPLQACKVPGKAPVGVPSAATSKR